MCEKSADAFCSHGFVLVVSVAKDLGCRIYINYIRKTLIVGGFGDEGEGKVTRYLRVGCGRSAQQLKSYIAYLGEDASGVGLTLRY